MTYLRIGAALLGLAAITPAAATPLTTTVAVTGGTLGIGPEIGLRSAHIGGRANATFFSFDHNFHTSDVDYQGHARLSSAGATFDLFPFGGGFRISAGARVNRNRGRVVAMPNQNTSVGGFTFTPQQIGTLAGRASVKRIAPTMTLGYGGRPQKGFALGFEAGAMLQGRVRISPLTSSTGMIPQDRLDRERADLQDDVGKYHVYPVVQVSLGYRF